MYFCLLVLKDWELMSVVYTCRPQSVAHILADGGTVSCVCSRDQVNHQVGSSRMPGHASERVPSFGARTLEGSSKSNVVFFMQMILQISCTTYKQSGVNQLFTYGGRPLLQTLLECCRVPACMHMQR